jgi:hypothetical protein
MVLFPILCRIVRHKTGKTTIRRLTSDQSRAPHHPWLEKAKVPTSFLWEERVLTFLAGQQEIPSLKILLPRFLLTISRTSKYGSRKSCKCGLGLEQLAKAVPCSGPRGSSSNAFVCWFSSGYKCSGHDTSSRSPYRG